jgi:hypothetical protein
MRKLTILTMIWLLGPAFSAGAVETARHNHALARSKAQSIQRAAEPTPRLAAPVDSYRACGPDLTRRTRRRLTGGCPTRA